MIQPQRRRQSRPFRKTDIPAISFPVPSTELLEHLEGVFSDREFVELHVQVMLSRTPAETALSILAEQAGKDKVLGYIRELIMRAREDALDRRPTTETN